MNTEPRRRGIASWAITHPIGTVMLVLTLLVLGVVYVGRVPVDLLPRIVYPQVRVSVSNPGVEPQVLEQTITGAFTLVEDLFETVVPSVVGIGHARSLGSRRIKRAK